MSHSPTVRKGRPDSLRLRTEFDGVHMEELADMSRRLSEHLPSHLRAAVIDTYPTVSRAILDTCVELGSVRRSDVVQVVSITDEHQPDFQFGDLFDPNHYGFNIRGTRWNVEHERQSLIHMQPDLLIFPDRETEEQLTAGGLVCASLTVVGTFPNS